MATSPRPTGSDDLQSRLTTALPEGHRFRFYHISTPPFKTAALCSAPPNECPDRTYCEKHFLAVSVEAASDQPLSGEIENSSHLPFPARSVIVLGLEVFVYTTAFSTTLFISKADSTGFLNVLGLVKGTESPIREICSSFIRYLVENRRRRGLQLVVSLFARAQGQYLFPGSAAYHGKHILEDRGLVKWWCRVLDPLLIPVRLGDSAIPWKRAKGYLVVPGLEALDARSLLPQNRATQTFWLIGHPLRLISHYSKEFNLVPLRCLIPRFPDDPKSRFRDELDEEAATCGSMRRKGNWKSVKTLDTFWEMMGFRQECSSGKMTGFIWIVFDDQDEDEKNEQRSNMCSLSTPQKISPRMIAPDKQFSVATKRLSHTQKRPDGSTQIEMTNDKSQNELHTHTNKQVAEIVKQIRRKTKSPKRRLRGVIRPRPPRVKSERRNYLLKQSMMSKYYSWPLDGRGEKIVDDDGFRRIVELLMHLDFATLDKAIGSSRRWIDEAGTSQSWGFEIVGTRVPTQETGDDLTLTQINNISGLVKRKRADMSTRNSESATYHSKPKSNSPEGKRDEAEETQPHVRSLDSQLVRKKPKTQNYTSTSEDSKQMI